MRYEDIVHHSGCISPVGCRCAATVEVNRRTMQTARETAYRLRTEVHIGPVGFDVRLGDHMRGGWWVQYAVRFARWLLECVGYEMMGDWWEDDTK